jgi:hypothetical protein
VTFLYLFLIAGAVFGYSSLIAGAVFGLLAGIIGERLRAVALILSGAIAGAYAVYVLAAGILAARCWDCPVGTQDSRGFAFAGGVFYFGLLTLITIAAIWAGVALAGMARRRRARGMPR